MPRLRSRQIGANRADDGGGLRRHEVGGGAEGEDRHLLRDVVGFERCLQYIQQEGAECVPVSMVDFDSVTGLWIFDDVDFMGYWHR